MPAQMCKIIWYAKANNLNLFNPEQGYVVASQVYMTTGVKANKCYTNIPFAQEVWAALSDPEILVHLEECIKEWNMAADAELKDLPTGAKLDLT